MSRRAVWILVGAAAATVAVWLYAGDRARNRPKPRAVALERGPIVASVSATGTVVPVVQVEVGSQVSGIIQKLLADYNDTVEEGQLIAALDPAFFKAAVSMADANVERAEAALHEAERAHRRAVDLKSRKLISDVELDAAESAYEQRRAELRQARASLETARVSLGHTVITAPISGVVVSRQVDVGQTVAASLQAPKLFVIAQDLTRMRVETKIDEADVGRIRPGLSATFTVDAFPDDSFQGTVSQVRLEPVVDQNVVTYTTVIDVPNPDLKLRPGMTANVTLIVDTRQSTLKIPNAALRFRPPDAGKDGGRAEAREPGAGGGTGSMAAAGDGAGGTGAAAHPGGAGSRPESAATGRDAAAAGAHAGAGGGGREQRVHVLGGDGRMKAVRVRTGITDGAFTEMVSGDLRAGMKVVVGMEAPQAGADLPPPPGFAPGRGPRR